MFTHPSIRHTFWDFFFFPKRKHLFAFYLFKTKLIEIIQNFTWKSLSPAPRPACVTRHRFYEEAQPRGVMHLYLTCLFFYHPSSWWVLLRHLMTYWSSRDELTLEWLIIVPSPAHPPTLNTLPGRETVLSTCSAQNEHMNRINVLLLRI